MEPLDKNPYYKFGIFYYNPSDSRTIVPKRNPMMGWTFNFAKPLTYVFFIIFFTVLFLAIAYT